ncbi:hypothetical protein H2198_006634 [Neophaeococcomyces mojaviensis]|uniref:Uncharacterized protein n=1 Tax=Neophaeococcomyces mojaviensis TaxID=3383035 RepID=A0ACC3A2U6_9EURO|nr:hypothetical protein H2198_006634 [Knufia sp. JES_112]
MATERGANIPPIKIYSDKFEDHVVLITGAAQGIGETTAKLFAKQGAALILVDIEEDKLKRVLQEIEAAGGKGLIRVCDISDYGQCEQVVEDAIKTYGKIDVLIQLAAIYPFHSIIEHPIDLYQKVLSININASFYFIRTVLPHMQEAGYGRIINTASGTLQLPSPGQNAYVTSKGGVIGMTRQLAVEAGPGITANVIMPGLIQTEHAWNLLSKPDGTNPVFDQLSEKQCVHRAGQPEDVAYTIAFIASPEASFISGQIFDCGGGATFH